MTANHRTGHGSTELYQAASGAGRDVSTAAQFFSSLREKLRDASSVRVRAIAAAASLRELAAEIGQLDRKLTAAINDADLSDGLDDKARAALTTRSGLMTAACSAGRLAELLERECRMSTANTDNNTSPPNVVTPHQAEAFSLFERALGDANGLQKALAQLVAPIARVGEG